MKRVLSDYFSLSLFEEDVPREPVLGKGSSEPQRKDDRKARKRKRVFWTLVLYFGVILGIIGQQFLTNMTDFSYLTLIGSIVLGTVVFPQVYKHANLNRRKPNLVQFFVAFQNGFFWQNLMSILTNLMENP
jgi:hypothetical protein